MPHESKDINVQLQEIAQLCRDAAERGAEAGIDPFFVRTWLSAATDAENMIHD